MDAAVNYPDAQARVSELKRIVLTAFAEIDVLLAKSQLDAEEVRLAREQLTPDYTEAEAAELLKISVKHLREERTRYKFPHQTHGVKITYSADQIRTIREMRTQNKPRLERVK